MKKFDENAKFILRKQLEAGELICSLDHEGDTRPESTRIACNVLVIPMDQGQAVFPVCADCYQSLMEFQQTGTVEYVLFICSRCSSTRWAHVSKLRNQYDQMVQMLMSCENCAGSFFRWGGRKK